MIMDDETDHLIWMDLGHPWTHHGSTIHSLRGALRPSVKVTRNSWCYLSPAMLFTLGYAGVDVCMIGELMYAHRSVQNNCIQRTR